MENLKNVTKPELKPVLDFTINGWTNPDASESRAKEDCRRLESGEILFFPKAPFEFSEEDRLFLLSVRQTAGNHHKNIAYRPQQDKVTGVDDGSADAEQLHRILGNFSREVIEFLGDYLTPYKGHWDLDYASFRPLQEQGRQNRTTARNDLLHVDNFPTRPTNGKRILRIFININPTENRRWITGETMEVLGPRLAPKANFKGIVNSARSPLNNALRPVKKALNGLGIKIVDRSPYDAFMHEFHNFMKLDSEFQENCAKNYWEFPPASVWMVYTDMVPHAVLSGQYALEQTFLIHDDAMVTPEKAPVKILEKLAGFSLKYT
ncbi:MAG: Kdo hydroxylase family protein [Candidatus Sumerlaeota bacterium]